MFKKHQKPDIETDFEVFIETTRFQFTWNLMMALTILFTINTAFYIWNNERYEVMIAAILITSTSLIYMKIVKDYKLVGKVIVIGGLVIISYSLLTIPYGTHNATMMYMVICLLLAYFILGKKWGVVISILFFGVFSYFIFFLFGNCVQNTPPYTLNKTIMNLFEYGICIFAMTYILYLFVLTNNYAQKQLKSVNTKLLDQNKIISDQNDEIRIKSKHKEEFLANMSHEIRTPLNAVVGYTDLMLKRPLGEKEIDYMNNINRASNSLLVLINDILDYSKIEAGKISIEYVFFDLSQSLHQLVSLMNVQASEKGLDLYLDIEDDVPRYVKGDINRIQQVLINLIGNAIKFTNKGEVTFRVSSTASKSSISNIEFSVIDTGIGIPKDKQALIFEKFTQSDSSTTREYGGTGLGLSISSRLVELMGGKLHVNSEPEEGSTFYFVLPLEVANEKDIILEQSLVLSIPGIENYRILLADDNKVNRILAVEMLNTWNDQVQIETANDGLEVLERLKNDHFDVVLMDLHMPKMNGLDTTKYIRQELKSDILIIALTASTLSSGIQACIDAGMNDFLMKPFKVEELVRMIALHLNLKVYHTRQ